MKAYVTLDYFDGSKSKCREVHLDSVNLRSLMFGMMAADVSGFTVTKKIDPMKIKEKMNQEIPNDS
jgi:hypothetical protein